MKKLFENIIKYRWGIALIVFLTCVLLHLHGSSMGFYNQFLPTQNESKEAESYNVIGTDRLIRTDEYAVHTSIYFSQYYNNYNLYSNQMSVGKTNTILDYYAPAKTLVTIGKPFNWGYLLFGNEIGISWYWSSCQVLLFMTAFELLWIITKHNKLFSLVGMFMIGLSPVLQWFFIPHITIVFIYGMALIDIGYYFFTEKNRWKLWLLTFLAIMTLIGFTVSLFPSMQVSIGLAAILILLACLFRDKDRFSIGKLKIIQLIVILFISGSIIGSFLLSSRADLSYLMNTSYPGKRVSTGGDKKIYDLFTNLTTIFLPYKDSYVSNNCEVATFVHFGPLAEIIYLRIRSKLKKTNACDVIIGDTLFVILVIQGLFMIVGFPELISKLTLFSYINRMEITYGWICVLMSIWIVDVLQKNRNFLKNWEIFIYANCYLLVNIFFLDKTTYSYLGLKITLMEFMLVFLLIVFLYGKRKMLNHAGALLMMLVMIFGGATVNPIRRGISPITNHPFSAIIANERNINPDAAWIVSGQSSNILADFALANGAIVFNATNFYPDFKKWEIIDPEKKYYDLYNRYSNQNVNLTNEKTYIELIAADDIMIHLNPGDLKKLHISYLMTDEANTKELLKKYDISVKNLGSQDGYTIYKLVY